MQAMQDQLAEQQAAIKDCDRNEHRRHFQSKQALQDQLAEQQAAAAGATSELKLAQRPLHWGTPEDPSAKLATTPLPLTQPGALGCEALH